MSDSPRDWPERADELAADAITAGEPTAWFERLYAEGVEGSTTLAWNRTAPNELLVRWFDDQPGLRDGTARRAIVVGAGLGADAGYVAGLGYVTVAFDVSATAVRIAAERVPGVRFQTADLFELPSEWTRAFDLVVEIYTVQALPRSLRDKAIGAVRELAAPGGTLCVIQACLQQGESAADGPPWPLTRDEMDLFGADGLDVVSIEPVASGGGPFATHWLGAFHRP